MGAKLLWTTTGKVSYFGGPKDQGVTSREGLALWGSENPGKHMRDIEELESRGLLLPKQPPNTTGLARRLDPKALYVACRWDYSVTPRVILRDGVVVYALSKDLSRIIRVTPVDWGPHQRTGRKIDFSPGSMEALGLTTDAVGVVEVYDREVDEYEARLTPIEDVGIDKAYEYRKEIGVVMDTKTVQETAVSAAHQVVNQLFSTMKQAIAEEERKWKSGEGDKKLAAVAARVRAEFAARESQLPFAVRWGLKFGLEPMISAVVGEVNKVLSKNWVGAADVVEKAIDEALDKVFPSWIP